MLCLPDPLGLPDVLGLIENRNLIAKAILRLKTLGNDLCDATGGRETHPIWHIVGGMSHLPAKKRLAELLVRFEAAREDIKYLAVSFASLLSWHPPFSLQREYIALKDPKGEEYALYTGMIASSEPELADTIEYPRFTNEYSHPNSTAKFCHYKGRPIQVGALSRFHRSNELLHPRALAMAADLGLVAPSYDPFDNNVAQFAECVHIVEDTIIRLQTLLDTGLDASELKFSVTPRAGEGVGSHEAPRGTLHHHYVFDDDGYLVSFNAVIPTGQNYGQLAADLNAIIPEINHLTYEQVKLFVDALVRAYDLCVSCSVH